MKSENKVYANLELIIGFNLENPAMTDLIIGRLGVNMLSWGTRQTQLEKKQLDNCNSKLFNKMPCQLTNINKQWLIGFYFFIK